MTRLAVLTAGLFALAGCCTAEAPRRAPPPPPPPPPPMAQQPQYTPPPPPPPAPRPPPTHYHSAAPVPGGAPMGAPVNAGQAEQIAVQYAQSRGFNVHHVRRVELEGRAWEVELQGHPPTPGQLKVYVDQRSGAVLGTDNRPGEGHEHGHGYGHDD